MTTCLITPTGDPRSGSGRSAHGADGWGVGAAATFHAGLVPVWLYAPTRRSLTGPLEEALLYAGRAQATLAESLRRLQRSDIGRLQVALGHSGQDVVILQAEHLHPLDLPLFARATTAAGVDLWLAPTHEPGERLRQAAAAVEARCVDEDQARAAWAGKPGSGRRRQPAPCEAVLPLGSGTAPARGCVEHPDAGGCVLSAFGHSLAAARTYPVAVRHRLHELANELPGERKWSIYAAARDPYPFLERALQQVGVAAEEHRRLSIGDLNSDGSRLTTTRRTIDVPGHLRAVLCAHRDIRVAEGSTPERPFAIPTDDRTRPRTALR